MKAVRLVTPGPVSGNPIVVVEQDVPEPGQGQLLIRVVACGVCRSNLHMIEGDWQHLGVPSQLPIVPGHEVTGVVERVGPGVEGFPVGTPVGVQPVWQTCETCEYCRSDREELCHSRVVTGEQVDGGYAEYMVSNANHTYRIPEGLDLAAAAPLFCPGITAFSAVKKLGIQPGQRVAVFGLGGVGHLAIQFARLAGAEVIAVSRGTAHRDVAEELGASSVVDSSKEDAGEVLTRAGGVDGSILFAPSNTVASQAVRALKVGGTLVTGVSISLADFPFFDGKTVTASLLGPRSQMREVLELAAAGKIRTVVDEHPLDDALAVLRDLSSGRIRSRAVLVTG
jgi:propanol-preferring alcohol dehydrogenase